MIAEMRAPVLLDQIEAPSLRESLARLMSTSQRADFAMAHVALSSIDLTGVDWLGLTQCRVLLQQFDVGLAADAASATPDSMLYRRLCALRAFADSGQLQVRSLRTHRWAPDFSIVSGTADGKHVLFVGAHEFDDNDDRCAVALTCACTQDAAVRRAEQHFEKLWTRADDVLAIVREQLERMQSNAMDNYITSYRGPFSITTPAPAGVR